MRSGKYPALKKVRYEKIDIFTIIDYCLHKHDGMVFFLRYTWQKYFTISE